VVAAEETELFTGPEAEADGVVDGAVVVDTGTREDGVGVAADDEDGVFVAADCFCDDVFTVR
jgi:hypothetical protein